MSALGGSRALNHQRVEPGAAGAGGLPVQVLGGARAGVEGWGALASLAPGDPWLCGPGVLGAGTFSPLLGWGLRRAAI